MVVEPWSRDETASFVIWTLNRSEITICLVNFPRWTSESRGTTTSVNHVLWHERKRLKRLNPIPLLNQWWNEVIKILIHASSTEKFQTSLHVSSLLQGMLLFHVSNPYLFDHHLRCVWDHNDSEPANPQSERGRGRSRVDDGLYERNLLFQRRKLFLRRNWELTVFLLVRWRRYFQRRRRGTFYLWDIFDGRLLPRNDDKTCARNSRSLESIRNRERICEIRMRWILKRATASNLDVKFYPIISPWRHFRRVDKAEIWVELPHRW